MTIRNGHARETLADRLRTMRIEAGLRQQDLADRIGMPQSFVSKCESGERRVDLVELLALCSACGADVVDFVSDFLADLDSKDQ